MGANDRRVRELKNETKKNELKDSTERREQILVKQNSTNFTTVYS